MSITVRCYEEPDLERCRSLWTEMVQRHRDIFEDENIGGDDPGREFDQHLAKVSAARVWVAISDDEIVGLVSLIVEGEQAEVEPIVVASRARNKGIGQTLLEHATDEARKLGVLCLYVKPVARNAEAISFFYDAGFKTLGHIQMFTWLGAASPGQWKKGPILFGRQFEY